MTKSSIAGIFYRTRRVSCEQLNVMAYKSQTRTERQVRKSQNLSVRSAYGFWIMTDVEALEVEKDCVETSESVSR